ncbi:MAG: winged helix-turn-helix domain-containing protein [Gemmatimonadales bacterium]
MKRTGYPIEAVAALFLERQHLTRPRARRLTATSLVEFVTSVGGLQLDSINVVARAHYLTLYSRFGAYQAATVDRLAYRRRLLFEYWAHAACLIPRGDLAAWRRVMVEYGHRGRSWGHWPSRYNGVLRDVEAAIGDGGPLGSADFEGPRKALAGAGWWNWKPTTRALDHLWITGRTAVHSRRHFHKRFDLFERVMPEVADIEPLSLREFRRWHLLRSLAALGAATHADLRMYLTFPRAGHLDRKGTIRELLREGAVVEVPVERRGGTAPWLLRAEDRDALERAARKRKASAGTTLLSPFDSVLWYRDRIRRLFGFDYTIEVYVPEAKRRHGYYSLPILHDGQLVGRVDAKTHREASVLELRHVHLEPWVVAEGTPPAAGWGAVPLDAVLHGLADAATELASFLGVERVSVTRVSPPRLRGELRRQLAALQPRRTAAPSPDDEGDG